MKNRGRKTERKPLPVGKSEWEEFSQTNYTVDKTLLIKDLIDDDTQAFRDAIQRFLTESVSYFDSATEGFYHGLTLGFLAILRDRYKVESNRESGDGRFDIALTPLVAGEGGDTLGGPRSVAAATGGPRSVAAATGGPRSVAAATGGPRSVAAADATERVPPMSERRFCNLLAGFPGVIIEVKQAKNMRQSLKKLAADARRQIDGKSYAAAMNAAGVTDILKIGLAYYRKRIEMKV